MCPVDWSGTGEPRPGFGEITLAKVRVRFKEHTGRADLVDATGSDAKKGADWIINRGQRWLDENYYWLKPCRKDDVEIETDASSYEVEDLISVRQIWVTDDEEGKFRLVRMPYDDLIRHYPDPPAEIDASRPIYYATQRLNTSTTTDYTTSTIYFMPPADADYTLTIQAYYYEPVLTSESDSTFWTEIHPELLVLASAMILEQQYRNTEGVKDMMGAIRLHVMGLEKHVVEEELSQLADEVYRP